MVAADRLRLGLAARALGVSAAGASAPDTGGQSGDDAKWCDADWVPAIRNLCQREGVAFFHKQWGVWASNPTKMADELDPKAKGGATLYARLWRGFPS